MEIEAYRSISELTKRAKVRPVIVGGSAVEIFTGGMYTTGDIDLVGDSSEISELLTEMGYERKDRFFVKGRTFVDLVGSRLAGTSIQFKIKGIDGPVWVISVEDLIVDRLCACKFWRSTTDCEQATYLYGVYEDKVDQQYLETRAAEEDVSDLLEGIGTLPKPI